MIIKCWHLLIKAWCWDSKKLSEDQNCTCTHSYTCCDIIFWQFTLKELQPQHNLYYCSTAEAIDVLYYCLLESTTPWLIHQCPPRAKIIKQANICYFAVPVVYKQNNGIYLFIIITYKCLIPFWRSAGLRSRKINVSFLFSIDTTKLISVEVRVTEHVLLQIELKMKKAEGIRWSSLEGEDEVKAKPIPKQGQSCWYKTFKLVIIVTCKMAQTDRYFKKWSVIL